MKKVSFSFFLVLLMTGGVFIFLKTSANSTVNNARPSYSSQWESDSLELSKYKIVNASSTDHLQVFLIEGTEELGNKSYITLSEAMEKDLVTVKETGSVNELSIHNNSDQPVFIHSGDIVKGGKQDRTIAFDVIIPPNAKNVPLQSFCVEQGRWQQRGQENVSEFESNSKMLSSKKLKMAARYENDQGSVWESVEEIQEDLTQNLQEDYAGYEAYDVVPEESASSLQLTLESDELKMMTTKMHKKLKGLVSENENAIGFAYAINGEIYGVDLYNNRELFEGLWNKISESIATEAASIDQEEVFELAKVSDVRNIMVEVNGGSVTEKGQKINSSTEMSTKENGTGTIEFNTVDKDEKTWIHRNYMRKN